MGKVYIILEDGHVFEGDSFGAEGETIGELVFTTGVVGYIETLSDPSYYGQIIMHTFPQIGNYGMNEEDVESPKCHARGVIVREWCPEPSNFRSEETVDSYLKRHGIVGVCGVDTREITQVIREQGVMNAMITRNRPDGVPKSIKGYGFKGSVAATSTSERQDFDPEGEPVCSVALMDYGAKKNILKELLKRGCHVVVLPHDTPASEVLSLPVDGIMLSNGPGDPEENTFCVDQIRLMLGKKPVFGICLGHQLLALAAGGKTEKLKYGHRGANQPAREISTGRVYITSQNHGYAVLNEGLESIGAVLSYENANDGTCEGLVYPGLQAFSLQFHPEAHSGPRDMEFAFDKFIRMMRGDV